MNKSEKKGIKIEHNKNVLLAISILIILLVSLVYYLRNIQNQNTKENNECKSDDDCVLQQTTCCSCREGGESLCMPKENATFYQEKIAECPMNMVCTALYNCRFKDCECQKGRCTRK